MNWFEGGVGGAIKECREKQALLIVYVCDDSEASVATSLAWDDKVVTEFLHDKEYLALKISQDSLEFNQFSQFYAVFFFPSIFCINFLGKALVVMHSQQSAEPMKLKLTEAFVKMSEQTQAQTSVGSLSPSVETGSITEQDGGACVAGEVLPSLPSGPTNVATSGLEVTVAETSEEKRNRYEKTISQRRKERMKASTENEKEAETKHREQGKNIAKFKEAQREQQNKNWLMERDKEKREKMVALEQVRSKLDQDRREREDSQRSAPLKQRQQASSASSSVSKSSSNSRKCRIQLRLPLGPTKVIELDSADVLALLREKTSEVLDGNFESFSLVSVYPHQVLTSDMDTLSMQQLDLTPSGVVIVRVHKKSSGSSNAMWAALMSVFSFVVWLFSIIGNAVSGLFSTQTPAKPQTSAKPLPRSSGSSGQRQNNIRKFHPEDQDDSDDMGTYNGNSTQQN